MNLGLRKASIVMALVAAGCVAFPVRAQRDAVEGSFRRTLDVSGAVDLDVSTGSGAIEIREGSSSRVEVFGTIRVGERDRGRARAEDIVRDIETNPPIEQTGSVIRIGRLVDYDRQRNISISYDIVVPRNTKVRSRTGSGSLTITGLDGSLDLDTGSGRIELMEIGGRVNAKTGSGSIDAENVQGGLTASTGSGRISASLTGPGNVELTTGSGSILVSGVKGALRASSGSGRIEIDGEATGRWDVSAGSGSVSLRLPPNAAFDLSAHTGSGNISVDHPITVQGRIGSRRDISGKVRGGGVSVDVRTSSGSIRIE